MNKASYLLVIDGSDQARAAAMFAWDLAQKTKANVVAQHVVDTPAVRGFLSYNIPGFVGSGVYIEAQQKITDALRCAAETVMLAYTSQSEGHEFKTEGFIDEGDTVAEISKRANDHSLVIFGQSTTGDNAAHSEAISLALAKQCKKPIVIVQVKSTPRSGVHLLLANEGANPEAVAAVYAFAKSASIPAEAYKTAVLSQAAK